MRKNAVYKGIKTSAFILLLLLAAPAAFSQTAEEIIRRMEANQEYGDTESTGTLMVQDRFGTKSNDFRSMSKGKDTSLIEFTSGEEKGQKILRTKNEIYLYYPDAEEVIRLQGAALREGVLGSDVSYEDMTESGSILDDYSAKLLGKETVDGTQVFKLELTGRRKDLAYPKEIVWVDATDYFVRKAEYYAVSGKLLKEMSVSDVLRKSGKVFPSRTVMQDKLKKESKTEFLLKDISINLRLDAKLFSLEELSW